MVVPRTLSLVCFRLRPSLLANSVPPKELDAKVNAINKTLADRINHRPDIFITATEIRAKPDRQDESGKTVMTYFLRLVIGGRSHAVHLQKAWEIVEEEAKAVCKEAGIVVAA